jgi:hypothetical protein
MLPRTFAVRTPGGGVHLYFSAPDQRLGNTAGKLGVGIDTRGVGGYVVGPGSVCNTGYYTIIDRCAVADLPQWVVQVLMPTVSGVARAMSVQQQHDRYLRAILDGEVDRVRSATRGTRNDALNTAAFIMGQLVGSGQITEDHVWSLLRSASRMHIGVKSFTQYEREQTIKSGLTAGMRRPRWIDNTPDGAGG